tara:strand:- start:89 stop:322 length:234 start_codon:yes stop_codon:yes gene_type:complete
MSNKNKEKLRSFILENSEREISELNFDSAIFETGILKSIQIMDLILFLEENSGKEIDVEGLKPGAFKDINTIIKNFF